MLIGNYRVLLWTGDLLFSMLLLGLIYKFIITDLIMKINLETSFSKKVKSMGLRRLMSMTGLVFCWFVCFCQGVWCCFDC